MSSCSWYGEPVRHLTRQAPTKETTMSDQSLERMDSEDLGTLAGMLELGTQYIAEQDEPEDQKNIPVMQEALTIIAGLVPVEVAENEPADEPEDEG